MRKAQQVHHYASGLYPESLGLQLREAQILASNGKHVQAIPRLKNLLSFEPHNEEIHLTLANIYSQMREHKLALQHFNALLSFADEELKKDIYIDVALEHENLGEWKQAVRVLLQALKEDPSNETALYELAFCMDKEGRIQEAADFYTQYLEDHPYSFAAWYNLGNALQRLGNTKKPWSAYDFAIAIEDSFAPAYHQKAEALTAMERFGDALDVHRETLMFDAPQPSTFCYMGECFEHLGRLRRSRAVLHAVSRAGCPLPGSPCRTWRVGRLAGRPRRRLGTLCPSVAAPPSPRRHLADDGDRFEKNGTP